MRLGSVASFFAFLLLIISLSACFPQEAGDPNLTKNTYIELVDWHVSGLMVINSPVAWIRVINYNHVPIKDIEFKYITYDGAGEKLNEGTYTLEGTVPPQGLKNFIEQYLGLVDVHSERLTVELKSVSAGYN